VTGPERDTLIAVHDETETLLPWYATGTLETGEARSVEAHLATCRPCRDELARCRALASAAAAAPGPAWTPAPADVRRVLARIETAGAAPEAAGAPAPGWLERLRSWAAWLAGSPSRLPRWALAAQAALVVLLAAAVGWQALDPGRRVYRTLETGRPGAVVPAVTIRVVFAEDLREEELRRLLVSIGGSLVAGPSTVGVYTIRVVSAAGTSRSLPDILGVLRAHPGVRLAEPAAPG
jgi:hypothetical protein